MSWGWHGLQRLPLRRMTGESYDGSAYRRNYTRDTTSWQSLELIAR